MKTTAEDLFFDNVVANNEANGVTESQVKDWRMNGPDRTKDLCIPVFLRNAALQKAGAMTIALKGSDDGSAWTDLATVAKGPTDVDKDGCIAKIQLAGLPLKQFQKLVVTVTTPFTVAPKLFSGLDGDTDYDLDKGHIDWNRDGSAG